MFYLGMKDLTANALIEILKARQNEQNQHDPVFVSYSQLEDYGMAVVEILLEHDEKAVFLLSRNDTDAFFYDYADFFEEVDTDDGLGIALKKGVELNTLIDTFRGYLPWSVLVAFSNERAVNTLKKVG